MYCEDVTASGGVKKHHKNINSEGFTMTMLFMDSLSRMRQRLISELQLCCSESRLLI